jgi:hypothetical protein
MAFSLGCYFDYYSFYNELESVDEGSLLFAFDRVPSNKFSSSGSVIRIGSVSPYVTKS